MKKTKKLDFINKIMDMEYGTTYSFRISEPDGIWYGVYYMELPTMIEYKKESRKMKDGWHTICGWRVLVDNNRVTMGMIGTDFKQKPIYPYRWSKTENCWVNIGPVSVAAFRTGIRRGTIQMF